MTHQASEHPNTVLMLFLKGLDMPNNPIDQLDEYSEMVIQRHTLYEAIVENHGVPSELLDQLQDLTVRLTNSKNAILGKAFWDHANPLKPGVR